MGIGHSRCRTGCMECALGCALTGNLNSVFYDGKAAENCMIFPMSVFLIFRKELSNFSTRVSNLPFPVSGLWDIIG